MSQASRNTDPALRAVVIGLGQVGSRFDEDPGRTVIWSHTGAYLALSDRVTLVGAFDPSPDNAAAFRRRCPDVPLAETLDDLITCHRPEIASICTPPHTHGTLLFKLLDSPDIRLIWCEKPLSSDFAEAERMVEACRACNVKLMVSYNRHWLPLWRRTRELVRGGAVGTVCSVRIACPNRFLTIGSHAVDLALLLGGPIDRTVALPLPMLAEDNEPAISGLFRHRSGAGGLLQVTGMKAQLMIESEVIGHDGRIWTREDTGTIVLEKFVPSEHFQGYRQLSKAVIETPESASCFSAFVAMAENAADSVIHGAPLECDGEQALAVQRVLNELAAAAP